MTDVMQQAHRFAPILHQSRKAFQVGLPAKTKLVHQRGNTLQGNEQNVCELQMERRTHTSRVAERSSSVEIRVYQ